MAVVVIMYPTFSNMGAEYATADAIDHVDEYVRGNDGRWPVSDIELYGAPISSRDVFIDYTIKFSELIASPIPLKEVIRP